MLEISHDAWTGSYMSFGQWRRAVARLARFEGIDWDEVTTGNTAGDWDETPQDPLLVLMVHSDCDGRIQTKQAEPLAQRLERVLKLPLPPVLELPPRWTWGSFVRATRQFIDGLTLAAARGEDLEFQ